MHFVKSVFWAGLVAAAVLGCSTLGREKAQMVWMREDGTPAERSELEAARDECIEQVDPNQISLERRWGHVEYASQVIDCIKSKGYHLVEATEE